MGKRRIVLITISDNDEDYEQQQQEEQEAASPMSDNGVEEQEQSIPKPEPAKPIGEMVGITGRGEDLKRHFDSFEYEGILYELEDTVLIAPSEGGKPYIAIIKDIIEDIHGNVSVTAQWFYRPEEAVKEGGGTWESEESDSREIFYSFHFDDVPAESIIHKCIVHFVPLHKQLPLRTKNPGFIVQRVYDVDQQRLRKLKDKGYKDSKQHEIDLLVQKTWQRIGKLPDVKGSSAIIKDDCLRGKKNLGTKSNMSPIDASTVEPTTKLDELTKAYERSKSNLSKYHLILSKFKVLTGNTHRDMWLEKLLQVTQLICKSKGSVAIEDKQKVDIGSSNSRRIIKNGEETSMESCYSDLDAKIEIRWPNDVIPMITTLERVTYEAMGLDFQKYNQKMRQFSFNVKKNLNLARRLLNQELEPIVLLTMTPDELKEGLTSDERMIMEPEETEPVQMTDAQCSRCMVKQVRVAEVIYAGGQRDRYQLECIPCGYTWYASRDEISSLTIDTPNVAGSVGTAPWATAKFDTVEKQLVSPRTPPSDHYPFHKSTEAFLSTLENRKSSSKPKTRVLSSSSKHQ